MNGRGSVERTIKSTAIVLVFNATAIYVEVFPHVPGIGMNSLHAKATYDARLFNQEGLWPV